MIRSKADLKLWLDRDLHAHGLSRWRFYDRWRLAPVHFQRELRKTEYIINCHPGRLFAVYRSYRRWRLRELGIRLGFEIYPNTFGPGLSIAHCGTIIINKDCRVGANCRIHPGATLGWAKGGVPVLGDDCYLGPGAKLFGPITLGDKTRIGANAVVNRSFPAGNVTLVGMPARPTSASKRSPSPCSSPASRTPHASASAS